MPRAVIAALAAATLAALGVAAVSTMPVVLEPGRPAWRRFVRGTQDGRLQQRSVVVIPGLERSQPRQLRVLTASEAGGAIAVGVDGGPRLPLRLAREGLLLPLPAARAPGLRLDIESLAEPALVRIVRLEVEGGVDRRRGPIAFGFGVVLLGVLALARVLSLRAALALGLTAATTLALAAVPAALWLSLPEPQALGRLAIALSPVVAAGVVTARGGSGERRLVVQGAGLFACAVFGAFIRGHFLPSTGAWDTEYWKAWSERAVSHGVTAAYGNAGSVPEGHFLAQLRGQEERFGIDWRGRAFTIDYPPLALALWRWSSLAVASLSNSLDPEEARNVAVKLPAVAGDLLAMPVLLWTQRRRPWAAVWCAAAYWALPVSWLSSAVLGFLDGSFAPLLLLAVAAAGERRPALAGAALALACLIKPTSAIVAPAMVMALLASRASLARAFAAGSAVVALALLPFALAGTLQTAVVHVYRILFQERLAGGYPNPWWLVGHALTLGPGGWRGAVQYARIELLPLPARTLGSLLFALIALLICWRQRGRRGPGPALLSAALLFFAYGMLAVGVHENHPHPLFLLLLGTGLPSWRLRAQFSFTALVYVVNMLVLSGLGRFHGLRYAALEPAVQALGALRLAPGFDLTLALALANLALFSWMLASLAAENEALRLRDNEVPEG